MYLYHTILLISCFIHLNLKQRFTIKKQIILIIITNTYSKLCESINIQNVNANSIMNEVMFIQIKASILTYLCIVEAQVQSNFNYTFVKVGQFHVNRVLSVSQRKHYVLPRGCINIPRAKHKWKVKSSM